MRFVAEFAMRGRPQALLVAVGGAAIPGFSWLGSAVVGLVTLRRGRSEGLMLLAWAILPAVGWLLVAKEPVPCMLLVGVMVLAVVLRETRSWPLTLMTTVLLSLPVVWVFEITSQQLTEQFVAALLDWSQQTGNEVLDTGREPVWLERFLIGLIAMGQLTVMLATLILARWWQSILFNPGGFAEEFRSIRLTPLMTALLLFAMLGCYLSNSAYLSSWMLILMVPFLFYGIALTHWYVAARKLGGSWLVFFYVMLVFFPQFLVPLMVAFAVMDSLMDLRGLRIKSS